MRKVMHKIFPIWKVEEEEKWLNQMADEGWSLVAVSFSRFEFERCAPGEYAVRLELLEKNCSDIDSQNYIRFMEETGAEQVGSWMRWVYFRKKRAEGEFELFSDRASRLKHMKRILQLLGVVGASNLCVGLYNVWLLFRFHIGVNALGFVNLFLGVLCGLGLWEMYKSYKKMKEESLLFE